MANQASNSYSLPTTLQHDPSASNPTPSSSRKWKHRLDFLAPSSPKTALATNEDRNDDLGRQNTNASRRTGRSEREERWWKIRLFRGMVNDVKRRLPYYGSDWTDAWDYRVVPATVYMYFAKCVSTFIKIYILFLQLIVLVYAAKKKKYYWETAVKGFDGL